MERFCVSTDSGDVYKRQVPIFMKKKLNGKTGKIGVPESRTGNLFIHLMML